MFGGKPIRAREYLNDTRGFVAELMAKSLKPEQMTAPMTDGRLGAAARVPAAVRRARSAVQVHRHQPRRDWRTTTTPTPDVLKKPLSPSELMKSRFMFIMSFGETDDQAAMMMEPVGGMDRIVAGFMRKVGHLVQLESQVQAIRVLPQGRRGHVPAQRRVRHDARADYVLNCIPMHLLAGIEHNFPAGLCRRLHRGAARQAVQDRPADEGALLGARRHLRRHLLDAAGHPADLVSGAWHPSPEGRGARRRTRSIRTPARNSRACRRPSASSSRSSRARRFIRTTAAMSRPA